MIKNWEIIKYCIISVLDPLFLDDLKNLTQRIKFIDYFGESCLSELES